MFHRAPSGFVQSVQVYCLNNRALITLFNQQRALFPCPLLHHPFCSISRAKTESPAALHTACMMLSCLLTVFVVLLGAALPLVSCNSEGDALHMFRMSLVDPANVLQSWDPTLVNPCTWFHVTCNQDEAVTRIDLGNSHLAGPLVADLGNLKHLQYLELYGNNLSGKIPTEFGKLRKLVSLDLYNNQLTGSIPASLGSLKSLTFLRLNNNRLSGHIPRSLTSITSLKVIDVSANDLCGTIPISGPFEHMPLKSFENNARLNGPELLGSVPYYLGCS